MEEEEGKEEIDFYGVAVILSRPDGSVLSFYNVRFEVVVDKRVLRGVLKKESEDISERRDNDDGKEGEGKRLTQRPKQRSTPPMKATSSSMTHIFSCCKIEAEVNSRCRGGRGRGRERKRTNMRPVESSRGEMRRRPLYEDVVVKIPKRLLGVERVRRSGLVRDFVAGKNGEERKKGQLAVELAKKKRSQPTRR